MGKQVTIRELVESIAAVTGYEGRIQWDKTKPDGQMYKGFDVTRLHQRLGFHAQTSLATGLQKTLTWFIENYETARLDVPVQPEWRNQAA
jgi:GDP-L-fucose synthase